ncbi:MAG: sugar phosphate isomerase/epimerase [Clostridia bacterium]|nr:sugar phosphate isomerase/epimerase [Clostridia bacterium]
MAKILLSAFADEYSADAVTHADYLAKEGVSFIEPRFVNGVNIADLAENEVKAYTKMLAERGIKASAIGSPIGKINLADDFNAHVEKAKHCFNAANIMGAKNIRMFSFYLRDGQSREQARSEVIEKLGVLLDVADTYGVTLCHENEAKIYGESPECCHDLMTAFGGRLRAVFDMGNFVLDSHSPYPEGYNLLREYIEYFHIKDSMRVGAIVPAGCGEARIADILREHLSYAKKDFFISLEPHLETFAGLNKLVGKTFENPYKFASAEAAFDHALKSIRSIIAEVE